jgi:site-specific DNA recombinase
MTTAAIYARVSSAAQKEEETIISQTSALKEYAQSLGLTVPSEWVFEDEGFSGSTLTRPALERLRDLVAQVHIEMLLCHAPDRLARKYAYQVLLLEEFGRAGTEVRFIKAPPSGTPEADLLVQVQGVIAEYEKAQIMERTRRGKLHRAKAGSVSVLSGAPFGYRYVRKSPDAPARYEVVEHQARIVREVFRRYAEEGVSLRKLGKWLTQQSIPTAAGKMLWDHSTVRQLLKNPAYCGRAAFGRSMQIDGAPKVTRLRRLNGTRRARPARRITPREQWIEIAVPPIVTSEVFELTARRFEDNRRFSARRTKEPSLLQGLIACRRCGYAYFRAPKKDRGGRRYVYYRCAGSLQPGKRRRERVCFNRPVRQDHLDALVWEHVTRLISDPSLIRRELDRRFQEHLHGPTSNTSEKSLLEKELNRTMSAMKRLLLAYEEDLVSLDELRSRMPELRKKEKLLVDQIESIDKHLADEETYLKLAENLESFLARLRDAGMNSSVQERQQVLRLIVREVLVDTDTIVIRHTIPGYDQDDRSTCHLWGGRQDPHPAAMIFSPQRTMQGVFDNLFPDDVSIAHNDCIGSHFQGFIGEN